MNLALTSLLALGSVSLWAHGLAGTTLQEKSFAQNSEASQSKADNSAVSESATAKIWTAEVRRPRPRLWAVRVMRVASSRLPLSSILTSSLAARAKGRAGSETTSVLVPVVTRYANIFLWQGTSFHYFFDPFWSRLPPIDFPELPILIADHEDQAWF